MKTLLLLSMFVMGMFVFKAQAAQAADCTNMLDYSDSKVHCVPSSVDYGESLAEDKQEQDRLEQEQKVASASKGGDHADRQ